MFGFFKEKPDAAIDHKLGFDEAKKMVDASDAQDLSEDVAQTLINDHGALLVMRNLGKFKNLSKETAHTMVELLNSDSGSSWEYMDSLQITPDIFFDHLDSFIDIDTANLAVNVLENSKNTKNKEYILDNAERLGLDLNTVIANIKNIYGLEIHREKIQTLVTLDVYANFEERLSAIAERLKSRQQKHLGDEMLEP